MRLILLTVAALIASCSKPAPDPVAPVETEVWQANARDLLCLKGNRAGFIVYGKGNANCAARGRAVRSDAQAGISPDGEKNCTFNLAITGDTATLRAGSGSGCAYYCGPGAAIIDVPFTRAPAGTVATDNADDPLC